MPVASQTTFSQGRRRSCFAIDANEPKVETADSIKFHWGDDRSGVKKIEALLGLEPMHRARDLFREWFTDSGGKPASAEVLLATYAPSPTFQRRFDSMWATSDFELVDFATLTEDVFAKGGDHALLVADLQLH